MRPGTNCRNGSSPSKPSFSALAAADGSFPQEVAAIHEQLDVLRRQFDTDPLTAADGSQALAAEIEAIRTRIGQLAAERRRLADELLVARRLLAEVGPSHCQAAEAVAQCQLKVRAERAEALPCPANDERVAALEAWLTRFEAEVAAGRWQPVRVGIRRWNAAARQYLDADRQARAAAEALLNQRRDLRGLLGA